MSENSSFRMETDTKLPWKWVLESVNFEFSEALVLSPF